MESNPTNTTDLFLNVAGSHSVLRTPELCNVAFNVSVETDDASDSANQLKRTMQALTERIRKIAPAQSAADFVAAQDRDNYPPADPKLPVTTWNVQRLHTWSHTPYNGGSSSLSRKGPAKKRYVAQTSYRVTFHDFEAMEKFVSELLNTKNVQFDHLSWAISTKSRRAVQTEVRTGAIKDAFAKATDYARAAQSVDQVSLRALHISDDSQGGLYTARGATMAAPAAFHKFSSQSVQESEPSVNFVPEPITIESTVHVRLIVV